MPKAKDFFTAGEQQRIIEAIKAAEMNTSGEIRLHLEERCKADAVTRAKEVFEKLGMTATEQRNGVLFYLAVKDHKFAILGDKGINDLVPAGFWDSVRDMMQDHFRHGRFLQGLCEGIEQAGHELKEFFPCREDDVNELDDDISFKED